MLQLDSRLHYLSAQPLLLHHIPASSDSTMFQTASCIHDRHVFQVRDIFKLYFLNIVGMRLHDSTARAFSPTILSSFSFTVTA
jgi:hypothetical protein